MLVTKLHESKTWLFWTGLLLLGLVLIVMLGSGLGTSQALSPPNGVEVSKTVNLSSATPGQVPVPLYTVTFTNPQGTEVVLDAITDTLPLGFVFVDMHPLSDWRERPDDEVEPEIVWKGPITIAASSELSLIYAVDTFGVAPSATPYANRVEAVTADGSPVGPASASIRLGTPDLGVEKEAWPMRVLNGELVTYTVVFSNSGYLTGTLTAITDTLDAPLSFAGMTDDSEVQDAPDIDVDSGTLTWVGPYDVPILGTLTLRYKAQTPAGTAWSFPDNRVEANAGDRIIGPAETRITVGPEKARVYLPAITRDFQLAHLAVAKSAFPTTVSTNPGQIVTYTVTIQNVGDTTGQLLTVYDTLPTGFTYQRMTANSDVQADPSGTTGTITWSFSPAISMPPGSQKRLIYRVIPSQTEGTYTNNVNVTADGASVQAEPASASVTVELGILLEEDFNTGIGRWTPFLNYWRLKEGQWYWGETDGFNGTPGLTQDALRIDGKEAEDALMMYLDDEAEDWTDYRVEAKMILRTKNYPHGLWVRGHYKDVGKEDTAGWVTGYYIMVGGKEGGEAHTVSLKQLQTEDDCWGNACNNPENLYDFNNPAELTSTKKDGELKRYQWHTIVVEVRGANIKVWLNGVQYIDFTDPKEPFLTGTVGLKTYKAHTVTFDDIIVTPLD
jgi:uncharacterized repeat protein (TIGR01451 family)